MNEKTQKPFAKLSVKRNSKVLDRRNKKVREYTKKYPLERGRTKNFRIYEDDDDE